MCSSICRMGKYRFEKAKIGQRRDYFGAFIHFYPVSFLSGKETTTIIKKKTEITNMHLCLTAIQTDIVSVVLFWLLPPFPCAWCLFSSLSNLPFNVQACTQLRLIWSGILTHTYTRAHACAHTHTHRFLLPVKDWYGLCRAIITY